MSTLTRQEVQNIITTARNQIMDRAATRQEMQTVIEQSRDRMLSYLHDFLIQNQQQFFRQLEFRNTQYAQRMQAMEVRISTLEQELRTTRQALDRLATAGQKPLQVVLPPQPDRAAEGERYQVVPTSAY